MAAKKDIAVTYRVNNTLDISVRNMGVRPRLGLTEPERQWEYVIKFQGTVLFKGTDLYTHADALHQEAAASALRYFVPLRGDLASLPWINVDEVAGGRARWFLANYRPFVDVYELSYITEFADVFAVLGDGSLAPFDGSGLALYGDHLDALREMEAKNAEIAKQESMANHPSNTNA